MPIHNWARVPAGLYHHFHQRWVVAICDALNSGRLPKGFYALLEQHSGGPIPDVVTLERGPTTGDDPLARNAIAVAEAPPRTRFVIQASDEDIYAAKADRIAIYNPLGDVVSVIEVVSPGNKNSRHALRSFVEKTLEFLHQGIHILVIDPFPPSPRDPHGIHKSIWDEIQEEPFDLPPDKPLTLASYSAGFPKKAYVEPLAVGDVLRDMPVFLTCDNYILAPLEATYNTTWDACPEPLRELVAAGSH